MIISRTPMRVSLLGGGTDYPQWFNEHGGAVLATAIDKYCYVMLHDGKAQSVFDLPTKSGLGTSSAYTVGLLRVCTDLDSKTIAKLATTWEYDKLGGNIGSQDQYICALGGFRHLRFDEHSIRDRLMDKAVATGLQDRLMLFDTHQRRRAGSIVQYQLDNLKKSESVLTRMMEMVESGVMAVQAGEYETFAMLLAESWSLKKELSDRISNSTIDAIYETAVKAGVSSGKILGAGGGGFILFYCETDKQPLVRDALSGLTYVPFKFEWEGTRVIYHDC